MRRVNKIVKVFKYIRGRPRYQGTVAIQVSEDDLKKEARQAVDGWFRGWKEKA